MFGFVGRTFSLLMLAFLVFRNLGHHSIKPVVEIIKNCFSIDGGTYGLTYLKAIYGSENVEMLTSECLTDLYHY